MNKVISFDEFVNNISLTEEINDNYKSMLNEKSLDTMFGTRIDVKKAA